MSLLSFKGQGGRNALKPSRARWLIVIAFVAYPVAMLMALLVPENESSAMLKAAFVVPLIIALVCIFPVLASPLQKLVGESPCNLDEFEMHQRLRSLSTAYHILTGMVALMLLYAYLSSVFGAWMPSTSDHWNGIFWGMLLYATVLPTAVLAFSSNDPVDDEAAS